MGSKLRAWPARAGLIFAAALALTACGSGSSTSAPTRSTTVPAQQNVTAGAETSTTTVPEPDSPVAGVEAVASSLQLDLQQLGYNPGQVDGVFAATTQTALRHFQAAQTIPAAERGAFGPATAEVLAARLGGSTDAVQALQSALTDVGLFNGTINGLYDSATLAAVKALQTRAQITVDGFYGPQTATALANLYTRKDPEPIADAGPVPKPETTPTFTAPSTPGPLRLGSKGDAVTKLQQRLTELGYRPGTADGTFGAATASAVLAFQKRNGLTRDSVVGPSVEAVLKAPKGAGPKPGPVPRIDVDIARQIIFVVLKPGSVITLNTSTGNGESYSVSGRTDVAYTPVGSFTVTRKIPGDHRAPLGTLRNPIYFYKGWAIHGAANVPAYPASHGCARVSNADADWLYPQIPVGTPVIVYDTTGKSPSVKNTPAGAAPGY